MLGGFVERAEEFLERPRGADELTLDVPPLALLGGVCTVVRSYLEEHRADQLPGAGEGLLAWVRSYAIPASGERWSAGCASTLRAPASSASAELQRTAISRPGRLARRHALAAGAVARNQRRRIMWALAEQSAEKGYRELTVSDLVSAAGVARDVFYAHFSDKLDVLLATREEIARELIATCSKAFYGPSSWPERVYEGLRTLTGLIAAQPDLARLVLVESFAAGRLAVRESVEALRVAPIFLEEGYHQRPQAARLPRLCSQAITGAIFELIYQQVAYGDARELPRRLPRLAYVAVAPFTGPAEATRLIEGFMAQRGERPERDERAGRAEEEAA